MLKFRPLTAAEVECRVATCTAKGVSLLLYKDARCDMNILDETVGAMNWQRTHLRDNANCVISIWDDEKKQWISKEDTGTESNTEAEKGLASDSFKRAGFNWGIGRELYTSPFIWIPAGKCDIYETGRTDRNGKPVYGCKSRFKVDKMEVTDGKITGLTIAANGEVVFTFGNVGTPICEECGMPYTSTVRKDGSAWPVEEMKEYSKVRFSKELCPACMKKKAKEK